MHADAKARWHHELEEWSGFFLKHGQSIARYDNVLFGLARHEGAPPIRACCDVILASGRRAAPWIRVEVPWSPPSTASHGALEAIASITFPTASCCALAADLGIVFAVERLGTLRRYDLARGRELQPDLDISSERPLALAGSGDGRLVAVAYDSGTLELIRLDPDAGERFEGQTMVWRGRFRVPEYETPALAFLGKQLWYQKSNGHAAAFDAQLEAETVHHEPPGDDPAAELRTVTRVGTVVILAWWSRGTSRLARTVAGGTARSIDAGNSEVTALCPFGETGVAIGFADRRVALVDVSDGLTFRTEITLADHSATCLAADRQSVWCLSTNGAFRSWTPDSGLLQSIATPSIKLAHAHSLVRRHDGSGMVVTPSSGSAFRLVTRSDTGHAIQTAVPTPTGYVALAAADQGFRLLDGGSHQVAALPGRPTTLYGTASGREVGFLFAADGAGRVLFTFENRACVRDPVNGESRACSVPEGACSVVGREHGGFWLADLFGTLYFMTESGDCRAAVRLPQELLAPPRLHCWGDLVVWTASRVATLGTGQDAVYVQVFLRDNRAKSAPSVTREGEREYVAADGVLQAVAFDATRQRLLILWARQHSTQVAIGTPGEFMAGHEQVREVAGIDGDCLAASVAPNEEWLYLLSSRGVLHCLDLETFEPVATFAGSRPLTSLMEGVPPRVELATVETTDRVILVRCERGGR